LEQEYQRNLIQSADEMGISLAPENARLATIHALLATTPDTSRDGLRTDFVRTPKLVTPLGRMVADLHTAILLNPYDPHTQYQCALFSPLGRYSIDPWLDRTSALDNSNHIVLFNNGLLAYYQDDHEQMISQWSNSLAIRHDHLGKIMELASDKVSIIEIAKRLVPSNRPDRIVALATVYKAARPDSTNQSPISELIEYVQNSARFDPAKRHATLAGLHNLQGNDDLAIEHWKQSLRLQPMNSKFRISLVSTLRDAGRPEDALNQAVLGQRLFPSDRRFDRQSRSIRRSLINL
jgi:tetratricopeptide (TPR) repeat protein